MSFVFGELSGCRQIPEGKLPGLLDMPTSGSILIDQQNVLKLTEDEPTASLDMASAKVVLELFKKLNREMGQTIVMVTHEPEDEKHVNRVIRLRDGLVEGRDPSQIQSKIHA